MPTLMVMLGNQAFAFPLVNVNEIFHLDLSTTNVVDGRQVQVEDLVDVDQRESEGLVAQHHHQGRHDRQGQR
ncbi:hypothetical protein QCD79_33875, partial [Pseudomonas quasicaspiana]|nr:hypothetical protein [Pseudomonas quasicaspiana]